MRAKYLIKIYLIEPILELIDIGGELEGLKLKLLEALWDEEVEDLFGHEVSQVSDNKLKIGVDSFSQFKDKWILDFAWLKFSLFFLGKSKVIHQVGDVVCI